MTLWEAVPLPRGRHHIPRQDVADIQRHRIFRAFVQSVAERGYPATPVAEIIGLAGVSRETFYQQFTSREDCFKRLLSEGFDAFDAYLERRLPAPELPVHERLTRLLSTYLEALSEDSDRCHVFLVDVFAIGTEAVMLRDDTQQHLVDMLMQVLGDVDRFAVDSLVAALLTRATVLVARGRVDEVAALAEPYADLGRRLLRLDTVPVTMPVRT